MPLYSSLLHMPANTGGMYSSDRRAALLRHLVEGSLASMASSRLIRVDVHFRDPPKYFSLDQVATKLTMDILTSTHDQVATTFTTTNLPTTIQ